MLTYYGDFVYCNARLSVYVTDIREIAPITAHAAANCHRYLCHSYV